MSYSVHIPAETAEKREYEMAQLLHFAMVHEHYGDPLKCSVAGIRMGHVWDCISPEIRQEFTPFKTWRDHLKNGTKHLSVPEDPRARRKLEV